MKRSLIRIIVMITTAISLLMSFSAIVSANTIKVTDKTISYSDPGGTAAFAKKLGMKKKQNKKYECYYSGKKLTIGTNTHSRNPSKPYVCVENKGNKKVTFYGVKIGDSKASVTRKLMNSGTMFAMLLTDTSEGTYYGLTYSYFKAKFKNGKLASWGYYLCPSE